MATAKQIHWLGQFAESLITLGVLVVVFRMIEGPLHGPIMRLPSALRVLVLLALVAISASIKTWRDYRKMDRRSVRVDPDSNAG